MAHFGPYNKKREEQLHNIRLKSDLLSDNKVDNMLPNNNITNGHVNVPRIQDVMGEALPRIGTYKNLDNTKQVVALIDDVSLFLIDIKYLENNKCYHLNHTKIKPSSKIYTYIKQFRCTDYY